MGVGATGGRGRVLSLAVAAGCKSLALRSPGKSRVALQAAEKGRNISISRISSKEISSHSNSCIWGNHFRGGCGQRREGVGQQGKAPGDFWAVCMELETSASSQREPGARRTVPVPGPLVFGQTCWTFPFPLNGWSPILSGPGGSLPPIPCCPGSIP